MWAKFKSFWNSIFGSKELQTCFVGLQNSGKTTLTNALVGDSAHFETIPTIGFNIRQAKIGRVQFSFWDLGGQEKFRNLWERYCNDAACIVFIVDLTATDLFSEAKNELLKLLQMESLEHKPLLIIGNKCDVEGGATQDDLMQAMELSTITGRDVACYCVSAKNKENLDVLTSWLLKYSK